MIKKTLLLLTVLLGFIGFSSAFEVYNLNEPKAIYNIGESAIFTFTNGVNFNINSEYFLFQHKSLSYNYYHTLFWSNTGLYLISSYENATNYIVQGFLQRYCERPYITESTNNLGFWDNCNYISIDNFISSDLYKNPSQFVYGIEPSGGTPNFCFNYDDLNKSICFAVSTNLTNETSQLKYSLGFTRNDFFYNISDSVKSYITTSPFSQGNVNPNIPITGGVDIGGYDYIPVHTGNYISYFEDKGFNIDMCYVGTKDLSGLYEDRLTYYQGTGYTIFDTYSKLFNVNSFKLSDIGIFLNYWLIDYDTWFLGKNRYVDGTPYYNMIYNSPSNYYVDKGPNLSNIFLGNKAVYFFLASSIRDRIDELNIGDDTALYCYYKLTRYANVSNDGGTYNITDDHSDDTDTLVALYVRNKINDIDGISLSGANVINSQSWDGSVLDNFTGDTYTDFSSFFSTNFNKYKTFFSQYDISDLALGQLPSYIVGFMLMLIFFRFLSH